MNFDALVAIGGFLDLTTRFSLSRTCTVLQERIIIDKGTIEDYSWGCVSDGNFQLLKWSQIVGLGYAEYTCALAARKGDLEVVKWLVSNGCWWSYSVTSAAESGNLELLKWCVENGAPLHEDLWKLNKYDEDVKKYLRSLQRV